GGGGKVGRAGATREAGGPQGGESAERGEGESQALAERGSRRSDEGERGFPCRQRLSRHERRPSGRRRHARQGHRVEDRVGKAGLGDWHTETPLPPRRNTSMRSWTTSTGQ